VKRREKKREKRDKKSYTLFAPLWQEKLKIVFIRKRSRIKGAIIPVKLNK
jgi:hypothetical protein